MTSLVGESGMSSGCPLDVHGTGALVGQAWSVNVGCLWDRWTGQDSRTSLVSECGMSSGCPIESIGQVKQSQVDRGF